MMIFVSSCEEDDGPITTNVPSIINIYAPEEETIGAITDMGLVATDLHLMQAVISNPGNLYENDGGDFISRVDRIKLNFYTASDGMIPSGTYYFSTDEVKQPFTFDSGILSMPGSVIKEGILGNEISDGTVTVYQDGSNYLFILSCTLNTGELFSGSSSGIATYQDLIAK